MSTPIMTSTDLVSATSMRPTSVLMLRTPVPPSEGTDPYHDTFGTFCLPSFPLSALESGSSTPLPPQIQFSQLTSTNDRSGADLLKSALNASKTGRRRGRWIDDDATLTTHHLADDPDAMTDDQEDVPKREYCVTSVPILGHRVLNAEQLADRIMNGSLEEKGGERRPYRGAIVTSQRAVEAWAEATQIVNQAVREGKRPVTLWPRKPFFAVGPATGEALRSLSKQLLQPLRTSLVMGAGATGTGELLATYIIRHFNGPSGAAPGQNLDVGSDEPPLLYLTGDKNAPTIRDALQNATPPIPVEELIVYETCLDPAFSHSCDALSRSLPPASASRPGSRRSSRAGSGSSQRRPSVGSLFGPGFERRKNSANLEGKANSNLNSGGSVLQGGAPLTAMTPVPPSVATGDGNNGSILQPTGSPLMVASPIDDFSFTFPLDTDIGLGTGTGTKPDWLVFFSPSGLQYALDDLRKRRWMPEHYTFDFNLQEYAKDSAESKERKEKWLSAGPPDGYPRLAVLGPTTKRWVRQNLGYQPDAVAASPGPAEMREAIRVAEKRIRREKDRQKSERDEKKKKDQEEKARLVGLADGGGVPMEID
ncbi:hypothetical protein CBS101457_004786 [Exobasidium rhododendri]|nr:hypothetical protein CBS101457_004786 [Exobasidium rhododendri]